MSETIKLGANVKNLHSTPDENQRKDDSSPSVETLESGGLSLSGVADIGTGEDEVGLGGRTQSKSSISPFVKGASIRALGLKLRVGRS